MTIEKKYTAASNIYIQQQLSLTVNASRAHLYNYFYVHWVFIYRSVHCRAGIK